MADPISHKNPGNNLTIEKMEEVQNGSKKWQRGGLKLFEYWPEFHQLSILVISPKNLGNFCSYYFFF